MHYSYIGRVCPRCKGVIQNKYIYTYTGPVSPMLYINLAYFQFEKLLNASNFHSYIINISNDSSFVFPSVQFKDYGLLYDTELSLNS